MSRGTFLRNAQEKGDWEKLQDEMLKSKMINNETEQINSQLRTRIQQLEVKILKSENMSPINNDGINPKLEKKDNTSKLVLQFKHQIRDLQDEISYKNQEIQNLKKKSRMIKVSELEVQNQQLMDESQRLRQFIVELKKQSLNNHAQEEKSGYLQQQVLDKDKIINKFQQELQNCEQMINQSNQTIETLQNKLKITNNTINFQKIEIKNRDKDIHQLQRSILTKDGRLVPQQEVEEKSTNRPRSSYNPSSNESRTNPVQEQMFELLKIRMITQKIQTSDLNMVIFSNQFLFQIYQPNSNCFFEQLVVAFQPFEFTNDQAHKLAIGIFKQKNQKLKQQEVLNNIINNLGEIGVLDDETEKRIIQKINIHGLLINQKVHEVPDQQKLSIKSLNNLLKPIDNKEFTMIALYLIAHLTQYEKQELLKYKHLKSFLKEYTINEEEQQEFEQDSNEFQQEKWY